MNRNFIFAFILLATLSIFNAVPSQLRKRITTFEPCPVDNPPVLDVTQVVPDPIISGAKVSFYISGKLPKAITIGSTIGAYFADVSTSSPTIIGDIAGLL